MCRFDYITAICLVCLSLVLVGTGGCAALAGSCFEFGGEYKGIDGTFKYCFAEKEATKVGLPIVVDKNGKKAVLLTEEQVVKINEGLAGPDIKTYKKAMAEGVIIGPFERLVGFLGR